MKTLLTITATAILMVMLYAGMTLELCSKADTFTAQEIADMKLECDKPILFNL